MVVPEGKGDAARAGASELTAEELPFMTSFRRLSKVALEEDSGEDDGT